MKKAHEEMNQVIGRQRRLRESDLSSLPYLQAICKEDTRLNVNIWAIGRDPDVWENPLEFKPERFFF